MQVTNARFSALPSGVSFKSYSLARVRPSQVRTPVPIYTIPINSKKFLGAGQVVELPRLSDDLFRQTETIDAEWILRRYEDIAEFTRMPNILVLDVIDHCSKDFEIAVKWARLANKRETLIDIDVLRTMAFAHDLGRMATSGINPRFAEVLATPYHGVVGREIFLHFRDRFIKAQNEPMARFCESLAWMCAAHTAGIGFSKYSNRNLGILPSNLSEYQDAFVWSFKDQHYLERLLIGCADAKALYPSKKIDFNGTVQVFLNGYPLTVSPVSQNSELVIDSLVNAVFIKRTNPNGEIEYFKIADFNDLSGISLLFPEGNKVKRISLFRDDITGSILNIDGEEEKLEHFELISVTSSQVSVNRFLVASRAAAHHRFDKFDPDNPANIDRAFEEVVNLVGQDNQEMVDGGWFKPAEIPS